MGVFLLVATAEAREHAPVIERCLHQKMVGAFIECVPMASEFFSAVDSEAPPTRLSDEEVSGMLEGFRRTLGDGPFLDFLRHWEITFPQVLTSQTTWLPRVRALAHLGRKQDARAELSVLPIWMRRTPGEAQYWSRELGVEPERGRGWITVSQGSVTVMAHTPTVCDQSGLVLSHSAQHVSLTWIPHSNTGMSVGDLAKRMSDGLDLEMKSVGLDQAPPVTVKVYENSDQLCRETGISCSETQTHTLAFANPWLGTAYWVCGHTPLHELVHVALGSWGGDRLDAFLSEGFATALDGTGADWRTPPIREYAKHLGSLDDLWLAYARDPETLARVGRIPLGMDYGLAATFAGFLRDELRLQGRSIDAALQYAGSRRDFLESGVGITDADSFARWISYLDMGAENVPPR